MNTIIEFIKANWTEISAIIATLLTFAGYKAKDWFVFFQTSRVKAIDLPLMENLEKSILSIEGYTIMKHREAFRLLIKIKLNSWIEQSKKLAEELDNTKYINANKMRKRLNRYLTDTVKDYRKEWDNRNIPIEVQNIFNEKHASKIEAFEDAITFITLNKYLYPNKMVKITAIFDKLDTLLSNTKSDLLEICTQEYYNGRLSGIEFNGLPLSDNDYNVFVKKENQLK